MAKGEAQRVKAFHPHVFTIYPSLLTGLPMKAHDIKNGNVVEHNGTVYQVRDIERSSPQGRGGNVKFRFTLYSVPGGIKYDLSVGGDDELKEVELSRRQVTYSYGAWLRSRTRTAKRSCSWTTKTTRPTPSTPT